MRIVVSLFLGLSRRLHIHIALCLGSAVKRCRWNYRCVLLDVPRTHFQILVNVSGISDGNEHLTREGCC